MKNKDKFDLSKITAYDVIQKGKGKDPVSVRYLVVLYGSDKVAQEVMHDDDTYIDLLFSWLEKEYKEFKQEVKETKKTNKPVVKEDKEIMEKAKSIIKNKKQIDAMVDSIVPKEKRQRGK